MFAIHKIQFNFAANPLLNCSDRVDGIKLHNMGAAAGHGFAGEMPKDRDMGEGGRIEG